MFQPVNSFRTPSSSIKNFLLLLFAEAVTLISRGIFWDVFTGIDAFFFGSFPDAAAFLAFCFGFFVFFFLEPGWPNRIGIRSEIRSDRNRIGNRSDETTKIWSGPIGKIGSDRQNRMRLSDRKIGKKSGPFIKKPLKFDILTKNKLLKSNLSVKTQNF